MKITEFKSGDLVTRTHPYKMIKYNENLGIEMEVPSHDTSFIGTPFEFIGIENNCVYLRCKEKGILCGDLLKMTMHRVDDNFWDYFMLPAGIKYEEIFQL